jgi:hypothetical protein
MMVLQNRFRVSIEQNNQTRLGVSSSTDLHLQSEVLAYPTFRGTTSRRRDYHPHLIGTETSANQKSVDESLLTLILRQNNYERWPIHSFPQPLAISSEGCSSPSGSVLNGSVRT